MDFAINVEGVTRTFGRTTALDDVSFGVAEGTICGLLGRNGAGKTTIMSIVSGQDRPTSGRVEVLGASPFENASALAQLSYVRDNQRYPDDYRLHHVLRIAPDFAPNWNAEIAAELVDGFRIPEKTPIVKFSRGQLSSVAIVLGLASRAPITLFDEPYLGLDVGARALFYDALLRDIAEHPRTILLSTHLIEESESLLDQVVIIDQGRVVANCDRDTARSLAVRISGVGSAVDIVSAGREVLQRQTVGGLSSLVVAGTLDESLTHSAASAGVQIAPASLQELVAAYGTQHTPALDAKKEVRA